MISLIAKVCKYVYKSTVNKKINSFRVVVEFNLERM